MSRIGKLGGAEVGVLCGKSLHYFSIFLSLKLIFKKGSWGQWSRGYLVKCALICAPTHSMPNKNPFLSSILTGEVFRWFLFVFVFCKQEIFAQRHGKCFFSHFGWACQSWRRMPLSRYYKYVTSLNLKGPWPVASKCQNSGGPIPSQCSEFNHMQLKW